MLHFKIQHLDAPSSISRAELRSLEHEAGLALCKNMLREHFGITEPIFWKNEHGKPFTDGAHFNISHSHGTVACVVSDTAVGIDIERLDEKSQEEIARLSERFFCDGEREYISKNDYSAKAFFYIWTRKEAISKCVGVPFMSMISYDTSKENTCIKTHVDGQYIISIATNI